MGIYKETKDYKLIHDNMLNMDEYYEYDEKVEMAKTGQMSLFDFDNE